MCAKPVKGEDLKLLDPPPVISDFDTVIFVDGAGKKGAGKGPGPAAAAIVAYNVQQQTVDVHTYPMFGTNNLCEHVAFLAALRRATGTTLVINDSFIAHNQVAGLCAVDAPHLQALVNESRPLYIAKRSTLTFAHMHGHKDKIPNHADPQCTWARESDASTGDASLFAHTARKVEETVDTRNWVPTNLNTLTKDQLDSFWAERDAGDRFAIWWSLAEDPTEHGCWTGERLTAESVKYLADGAVTTVAWPPAPNVRVHMLTLLVGATRRGTKGLRMKHVVPHTIVKCDLDETLTMFAGFGTEAWVKWCIENRARRTLPKSHWFAWASIVKRFLCAANAAGDEDFADAAHVFLGLPNLFLDVRIKNAPLHDHLVRQTMSRRLDGSAPKYQDAIDPEEKSIRQAQTLAEQGFIGKACKAIGTNRVLDGSVPAVRDVLVQKHPSGDFVLMQPPLSTMPYHAESVQKALRKCANGSAPSWSGWTKELLMAACTTDPDLFHHLAVFLSKLQGSLDQRLSMIVRVGKLIALNNARSPDDPDDPRPITISELFSKLLGLMAMDMSRWSLHPCQRGLHHKGGTHQAIIEVQRAYDDDLTKVVATFDVSNAFNATRRAKLKVKLDLMGLSAAHLMEYFRWMYGSQSDVFIRSRHELEKYLSCEGVRQGDMPASLLFSLVFTDAAIAAASPIVKDVLNSLWLYLDDVTLVETVDVVIAYKVALEAELEPYGLHLNMKKCRVLVDRCTPEEIARLIEAGFQLDYGCTRVLGSPVGDQASCRAWVLLKVTKWQPFWEKVRHNLLSPFTALLILSKCGHVKFHHLAKSLPPEVVFDAAVIFDDMVDDSIDAILARRCKGVDQHTRRAVCHLAPYVVTCRALYENSLKMIAGERVNDKIDAHHAIVLHYEKLPAIPFVGPLVCAVQGVTAADTFRPTTTLCDSDAVNGLLLRHGVAPLHLPTVCSCNHYFGRVPVGVAAIHHLMHCPDNVGRTQTTRHHEVNDAIKAVLFLYGLYSIKENNKLHPYLRPDLHIVSMARQIITDVTIVDDVYTGDPNMLQAASDEKHVKYDALAGSLDMDFFALPISAYGRLHSEVFRFIDTVALKAVNPFRRSQFKQDMRTAIQHALLKGTADVANAAVARLCNRTADWIE